MPLHIYMLSNIITETNIETNFSYKWRLKVIVDNVVLEYQQKKVTT